jgi:hypothetical protein
MMFTKRTLFIIGAGASQEVGLPVGSALATTIAKMFSYKSTSDALPKAMPPSYTVSRKSFPISAHGKSTKPLAAR